MKKGITIILAAVLALGMGLGVLSAINNARNTKQFVADGYILDPSDEEFVTDNVNMQYYFTQGTKYKEKFGTQIAFKSASGTDEVIDADHFIHYNDGSLGSFKKGVIMDVSEIAESNYGYYSLSKNTVLVKNGGAYEMTSRGEAMNITEFIWKISDTDYMLMSPDVTLRTNSSDDVQFSDYVQLTYVDNGVVRISHQTGTYQTVAADSKLVTKGGAELNLVGKSFVVDGEEVLSLDDMTIDDNSYIDVDENITDGPNLPTFNVINGKDGVSGTNGTDGEQGEAGEEGKEGEQGAEGEAGAEGAMGSTGGIGKDGMEGDTGIMGYDGAEGLTGKDAQTAASASSLASVDLNARPEITLNAGSNMRGYDVTSDTATMTLTMEDPDNSLVQGTTTVKLYDRATMKLVGGTEIENKQLELGAQLESNPGGASMGFNNLKADTEYVLVVEGEYDVDGDGHQQKGIIFQKIFRTEPLGIAIAKHHVTDTEIAAITKVTGDVQEYEVKFYYYDGDQKKTAAIFKGGSTGTTFTVNDNEPAAGVNARPNEFIDVKSNTTYYAELGNVISGSGKLINTDGSEIELKTLKETPYDYEAFNAQNQKKPVSNMQPTLSENEKNHTLTVGLGAIVDPDSGISSYKVELFNSADIDSAVQTGSFDELVPAYSKEMTQLSGYTFSIPSEDTNLYRARVTVTFNDNEKDMDISTLFSDAKQLGSVASNLAIEIQINEAQTQADTVDGFIKITDGSGDISTNWDNTEVLQYIGGTNPLKLTITGEYRDSYVLSYADNLENKSDTTWGSIDKSHGSYWLIPFKQTGLHQNSVYTLVLSGPQDTDGNKTITGAEGNTYLAGTRVQTKQHKVLALAARKLANPTSAFKYSLNVTSVSDNPDDIAGANYSASVLERMELQLIQVSDSGIEKVIGNASVLVDPDTRTHDSKFKDEAIIDRSKTEPNPDITVGDDSTKGLMIKGSEAGSDRSTFTIEPNDFGIDNKDNALFSGGEFRIKVVGAYDYTYKLAEGAGGNEIPFKEGENLIRFGISKQHVQASNPNTQVEVIPLTNSAAATGYAEDGVDDGTVVGLRFRAEYRYADIKEIYYYIYELEDSADIAANQAIYKKDGNDNKSGVATVTKATDGTYMYGSDTKCNLVLTAKHIRDGNNDLSAGYVELYFKNTAHPGTYVTTWEKSDGSVPGDNETILERGKRYIIAYRVLADHEITPCISPDSDHFYPDCTYEAGEPIPFYRSSVIELHRQTPSVERYPLSSETGKDTWNYRIIDPDKSIVTDGSGNSAFEVKKADTYAGVSTASPAYLTVSGMDGNNGYRNNNDFKALDITGLGTDGQYYSVGIPYKTLSATSSGVKYITSKPVQHFNTQTVSNGNIYLKGLTWTTNDNAADKYPDNTVKPIVNEGNYRYRLTLMGSDIDKFAAFRVVFSKGSDNVVYDPVYVTDRGTVGTTNPVPYAYAYVDQGPLADKFNPGDELTVTVSGYYSTRSSGYKDFESLMNEYDKKTFYKSDSEKENLFALRRVNVENGNSEYLKRVDGKWITTLESGKVVLASMYVPGNAIGAGITINSTPGSRSNAYLNQRFYYKSLVMDDTAENVSLSGFGFNESGLHIGDNYYVPEKLAKTAFDFGIHNGTDHNSANTTLKMETVVAAIKEEKITAGAKSATLEMSLHGVATPKVYAKLIQKGSSDNAVKIKKGSDERGEFFEVSNDAGTADYGTDAFRNNSFITVTNNTFTLRFRGLTTDTKYGVLFFTYDNDGKERPLYCIGPDKVNIQYEFKTLKEVAIDLEDVSYSYETYLNKAISFRFGIPGDEGVGMTVQYKIVSGTDIDTGSLIAEGTVEKQNKGTGYEYYSQRSDINDPFGAGMAPGSGPIHLGQNYTVKIWATDDNDPGPDNVLGSKTKTFQTPTALTLPDLRLTATAEGNDIKASIMCTDTQKALLDGKYEVKLYKSSDTDTAIDTKEVSLLNNALTESAQVTFAGVDPGDYLVRVEGKADLNNNKNFDEPNDVLVIAEAVKSTGSTATASIGASATVDELKVEFYNLSNFANVRSIVVTAYKSGESGTIVYTTPTGGIDVSEDEAKGTSFEKTFDWSGYPIESDTNYEFDVQYRSESGKVLGGLSFKVKTEPVQTTGE